MRAFHFTPLPPKPNGIADYAGRVLAASSPNFELFAVTDNPFSNVPDRVTLVDHAQAWRLISDHDLRIYQIGNNEDHKAIIKESIRHPGLAVIHDARLLHVYETINLEQLEFIGALLRSNPILAPARAKNIVDGNKQRSDYIFFDMLHDIVKRSRGILTHSHFAKNIIRRHYGEDVARRVHVVPHFAIEGTPLTRERARKALEIDDAEVLIVTSGFATDAKRFDWLIEALSALADDGQRFQWIHAGAERVGEFDLSGHVQRHPGLGGRFHSTGYLDEQDLDTYIAAADIVVNLRFPSVGESSGTLSRALAYGVCCIVTDTGAYSELPDSSVVKIPIPDSSSHLRANLSALIENSDIRNGFAESARKYASTTLSMARYIEQFENILVQTLLESPVVTSIKPEGTGSKADHLATLGPFRSEELEASAIIEALGDGVVAVSASVRRSAGDGFWVDVFGIDAAHV